METKVGKGDYRMFVKTEQNRLCPQQPLNWLEGSLQSLVNNRSTIDLQLWFNLAKIHEEIQKLLTACGLRFFQL